MYEDPVVKVARITFEVRQSSPAQSPVVVALAVKNANDYPLSAEEVELSLQVDGIPLGHISRDSSVPVATNTISTVALPLSVTPGTEPRQVAHSGLHRFAVRGRATFQTPIGLRKVRFAQEGSLVFGERQNHSAM
jgi:late embryogenesis abundant protein